VLAARTLYAGPAGAGQAGAALGDYLRGAQLLAASEALRIGQLFGLDSSSVVEIGESLSGIGAPMAALLREHVLRRTFDTGMALGHVLKGLETTANVAQSAGAYAPLLAACRAAWSTAEATIGSGADQSELLRWLEAVVVQEPKGEA
jgi:3-hydroxyisobutyrate dehydrogenase